MYGCKMPEDQNEKTCYKIQVTEVCSLLLIISPGMIAALIAEMRRSSTREMLVPADEILPPGYAEYLKRVLAANEYSENVYDMAVEQFRRLEVEQSLCFDRVNVTGSLCLSVSVRHRQSKRNRSGNTYDHICMQPLSQRNVPASYKCAGNHYRR